MYLITGSTGYVGTALTKFFNKNNIPYKTYRARYPLNDSEFENLLVETSPHAVINCAGFTGKPNVDACEKLSNQRACLMANAFLPKQILSACRMYNTMFMRGMPLVHISSGCIFQDNNCDHGLEPLLEFQQSSISNFNFETGDASYYSGTKALGEKLLLEDKKSPVKICRLRIPFNGEYNERNYLVKLMKYKKLLNATNSLTNIDEFVEQVYNVVRPRHAYDERVATDSIYNLTQPGYITTKEIISIMSEHGLVNEREIEYFDNSTDFLKTVQAPRSNCVLQNNSVEKMTDLRKSIEESVKELHYNINNEKASSKTERELLPN